MFNKTCNECGMAIPFISRSNYCKECDQKLEDEFDKIEEGIIRNINISGEQLATLDKFTNIDVLEMYVRVYENYVKDKELDDKKIAVLNKIQKYFNFDNSVVGYNERILPYIYIESIKTSKKLPVIDNSFQNFISKKNEFIHYGDESDLSEREMSMRYSGGSSGINFNILPGISYRIGQHEGQFLKEENWTRTSRGILILTNKRLFFNAKPGYKPLSIDIEKILSYSAYRNGLEVYGEGSDKRYFFGIYDKGSIEVFGICLSFLMSQIE